ncbi:MAG: phosphoglycerate kinase [Verrucomicrobiota bacterium]|nr:phosphoglycerate kinase [Verrucomicrobiota bacterium]
MNLNKKTVKDIDLKGKKIIMRADFNVPLDGTTITDDTRIRAALPTINYVLKEGASLILMSHLGRPKGFDKKFSLKPVAEYLSDLLGQNIPVVEDCLGEEATEKATEMTPGTVIMLDNTRYYKEEQGKIKTDGMSDDEAVAAKSQMKQKQKAMAKKLASYADVYVNDAFGTAHRAHASTAVICDYMDECVSGFLIEKEIKFLGGVVANPEHPFVAIIGGAKVSGKLEVLETLLTKVDYILIGGGMAYTFLKALGHNVGGSLVENDLLETAKKTLDAAEKAGVNFMLPTDNLAADNFANDAEIKLVGQDIEDGWMALDVGPETAKAYAEVISKAKTVVWNGPMGCFEMPNFADATNVVCKAVAESSATSIIGGGDSVSAVQKSGLADQMSHISTGGGASLEFLEGKTLPGIAALNDR